MNEAQTRDFPLHSLPCSNVFYDICISASPHLQANLMRGHCSGRKVGYPKIRWAGRYSNFFSQSCIDNNLQINIAHHLKARRISSDSICARVTSGSSKCAQLCYGYTRHPVARSSIASLFAPKTSKLIPEALFPVTRGHWARIYCEAPKKYGTKRPALA
jgi:hypothetical protein